jgi:hypothetical protein
MLASTFGVVEEDPAQFDQGFFGHTLGPSTGCEDQLAEAPGDRCLAFALGDALEARG